MAMSDLPVLDKDGAAAARAALVQYQAGTVETPKVEIAKLMAHLALVPFGMTQSNSRLTEQEEDRRLILYCRALAHVPIDLLKIAFARVSKSAKFFPAPVEIADQVRKELAERCNIEFQLMRLIMRHEREWVEPGPPEPPMSNEQIYEANLLFKSLGIKTRYGPDGETFQVGNGVDDPVVPDAGDGQ